MKEYYFAKLDSEFSLSENLLLHFLLIKSSEKIPFLIDFLRNKID